jgi:hypothetical protein
MKPLTIALIAAAVALVVVAVVFFATSHPLRGAVVIGLAVLALIGAWFANRGSHPNA